MTFCEALKKMQKGCHVTRRAWDETDKELWLHGGIFMTRDSGKEFPCVFFSHEILADDWELL